MICSSPSTGPRLDSHFCEPVTQPGQIRRLLPIAIRTALGRQGVSVLTISGDVALREVPDGAPVPADGSMFSPRDRAKSNLWR